MKKIEPGIAHNIETLDTKKHNRESFDCGHDDMTNWLKKQANQSDKKGNTLTRVYTRGDSPNILGYYSQKAYQLEGEALSSALGDEAPYPVPCVLLARLARCETVRGENVGRLLLAHAMRACIRVSEDIGLQFVVVHAIDDRAVEFYKKYGFESFLDHEMHMLIPLKTLRQLYA